MCKQQQTNKYKNYSKLEDFYNGKNSMKNRKEFKVLKKRKDYLKTYIAIEN